jgi:hypothetical protein
MKKMEIDVRLRLLCNLCLSLRENIFLLSMKATENLELPKEFK